MSSAQELIDKLVKNIEEETHRVRQSSQIIERLSVVLWVCIGVLVVVEAILVWRLFL